MNRMTTPPTYDSWVATPKVILYYAFAPLADPEAVKHWQLALCQSLGLRGRIIVSKHGINGTLGGDVIELKKYVRALKAYTPFKRTEIKWSEGEALADGSTALFPRLSIKVRPELVAFDAPDEIEVDANGIVGGGTHLNPQELHELVESKDVVFFDGRNYLESEIGRFKGAIRPKVNTTREFLDLIDSGIYDDLKDKPLVTYCTGGIRCEVLTPLLKKRGFNEVYQIDGGIVRYGEAFGDSGLWEGSLYVFDGRMQMDFSNDTAVIGTCDQCGDSTKHVGDCVDERCVGQFVRCEACCEKNSGCIEKHAGQVATVN